MWRHLSYSSGKFAEDSCYHARFQASSGHSDSANWPTKYLDVSLCVRPDVMKRYVMGQFLFPGNIDFASMTRAHFHVVFMKSWCVYSSSAVKLIWWIDQVKLIFNAEVLVWSSTDVCSQASRLCPLFLNNLLFLPSLMNPYSSFHTRNPST